ncbi:TfoX/Sxy family protein [Leucobacter soli]|nr:TfoX/Sxy family protein [Leucobacter soli]
MGTREDTVEFLLDQLSALPNLRTRKMFGEYCLYADDKPVAFICDDELFVKPTPEGKAYLDAAGALDEAPAYPGSKLYLRIGGDRWEDRDSLAELIELTSSVLPAPKPKRAAKPQTPTA